MKRGAMAGEHLSFDLHTLWEQRIFHVCYDPRHLPQNPLPLPCPPPFPPPSPPRPSPPPDFTPAAIASGASAKNCVSVKYIKE